MCLFVVRSDLPGNYRSFTGATQSCRNLSQDVSPVRDKDRRVTILFNGVSVRRQSEFSAAQCRIEHDRVAFGFWRSEVTTGCEPSDDADHCPGVGNHEHHSHLRRFPCPTFGSVVVLKRLDPQPSTIKPRVERSRTRANGKSGSSGSDQQRAKDAFPHRSVLTGWLLECKGAIVSARISQHIQTINIPAMVRPEGSRGTLVHCSRNRRRYARRRPGRSADHNIAHRQAF
jgi:hypothetical protein